jgi:hypothetical protein
MGGSSKRKRRRPYRKRFRGELKLSTMLMDWEEMGMSDVILKRGADVPQSTADGSGEAIVARRGLKLRAVAGVGSVASLCGALAAAGVMLKPESASAVPSFARQTGQVCAACHTMWPQLTPYGRRFKLGGYQLQGGLTWDEALPVAGFIIPTFSHTQKNQDAVPSPAVSHTNNNILLQEATGVYGGIVPVPGGGLGAFIQVTYDGAIQRVGLNQSDVRYVKDAEFLGYPVIWGVDVNNNPSVEDVWGTTPAYSWPFVASSIAPQFAPPGTLLEGTLATTVIGAGGYTFWNDMLYLAAFAYQNINHQTLSALGIPPAGTTSIDGVAPYWRAALEMNFFNDHWLEIGTYGMYANTHPNRINGFGGDQILDIAVDMQYQWLHDPWSATVRVYNIHESQQLNQTYLLAGATNLYNYLNSFNANAEVIYDHMWGVTFGYFNVRGSADALLWSANSLVSRPNGEGFNLDLMFMPFAKGGPKEIWPWLNARIGVQYTSYLKLFGGNNNFDGLNHNAADNNTLLLYTWIDF